MYSTRYSCQISMKLEFLYRYSKNTQIPDVMKIRPVKTQLCHTDGRDKTNNFSNFASGSKKKYGG
jgi:transposase